MTFTLHEKISESATTCVYRAFHETLGREVLLKVLHRHLANDVQVRQRFVREARACAAIRSEHVVRVFDLRDHDGSPAIVMEYVTGQSLKDVIADGKHRAYAFTEKVAVHVLRGLAAAHAQGIIHRDIKPGNILVARDGTIKITDFGLAQVAVAPTLTTEGMVVGTPAYFAPEVIRGEAADARTDLFSLGATLVETLTGKQLFEGATYSDCLNCVSRFKPDMLDSLLTVSPPEFVTFLKKMMHPDRDHRYSSPKEALAALGKLGSSEFAIPVSLRSNRTGRRWFLLGAAVLFLAILTGLYVVVRRSAIMPASSPGSSQMISDTSAVRNNLPPVAQKGNSGSLSLSERPSTLDPRLSERKSEPVVRAMDSGSVTIASTPGAKVYADSLFIGDIPLKGPLRLATGLHTIVFMHRSFEPIVRTVRVKPGQVLSVTADFLDKAGYLRCTSTPWAEISIDGQYRDTTPIDRPIALTAGTHRVRFHHPAFRDSVWELTIAPQETVHVSVTFR